MKVCHVNARSLLASCRLLDLEIMCANHGIDVLCVSETWLSSTRAGLGFASVNLPGFQTPFRCDRSRASGQTGGGVAVYVRCGIPVVSVDFSSELEAVCVELRLSPRKSLQVIAIYRPPKSDFEKFLDHFDTALTCLRSKALKSLCIVGDFNVRCSSWWSGQDMSKEGRSLEAFMSFNGLVQVVDGPTRAVGTLQAAQLDLMKHTITSMGRHGMDH